MAGFQEKYDSSILEEKHLDYWQKNNIYKFKEDSKNKIFSIDTPPPTVSGKMHMGHAYSYAQTDFIARYKRMKGYNVFYPFGTDDNGLATEKLVQKQERVNLRKVPRQEAILICQDFLKKERPLFLKDFKRLGLSADFNINYSTIDSHSRKISQKTFIELAKKGLIYRKEGPVMWDRVFQTPIAQAELEDKQQKSNLYYLKAKVKNTDHTYVLFGTTRPELLFACAGFSLQENGDYVKIKIGGEYWIFSKETYKDKIKDEFDLVEELKGKNLLGEKVIIPLTNKEIEITHDSAVQSNMGSGTAYFCSYGGLEDIEYFSRHNLKPIEILNKDGTLNEKTGNYKGLLTLEARKKIVEELKEKNYLGFTEKINNVVNIGERSGVEVEYIVTKQWFVKYLDKKEYLFEKSQEFNWKPEFMKHRLENWIKGLNWDWGFSRQRHFGIPVPVWYDKKGEVIYPDESQLPIDPTISTPKGYDAGGVTPETDVMDTWFTSASTPDIARELIKNEDVKKQMKPMDMRPQGHDIINFWLFYTMAKTNLLNDMNPFKDVVVSGWILDPHGKKMSKSKGNAISPQETIQVYGADALRFSSAGQKLGMDIPFQEKELKSGKKLVNKLYNANKFANELLDDFENKKVNLLSIDKWVLQKLSETIKIADEALQNYDVQSARNKWYNFFMHNVADYYIEIVKDRLRQKKNGYRGAQYALYKVLYNSLKGLAPIMPFVTEDIYQKLYKKYEEAGSIHLTSYPSEDFGFGLDGDDFIEIISKVRKFKAEKNMSMNAELKELILSDELNKDFIMDSLDDLKSVTGARKVVFKKQKELVVVKS